MQPGFRSPFTLDISRDRPSFVIARNYEWQQSVRGGMVHVNGHVLPNNEADSSLCCERERELCNLLFQKITCINSNVDYLPNSCWMMVMLKVELNCCFSVGTESMSKSCVFGRRCDVIFHQGF